MNAIKRAIKTGTMTLPVAVWTKAHLEYPKAVGLEGLYGVAFFGHGYPKGTVRSTESVWRGVVRKVLREYIAH